MNSNPSVIEKNLFGTSVYIVLIHHDSVKATKCGDCFSSKVLICGHHLCKCWKIIIILWRMHGGCSFGEPLHEVFCTVIIGTRNGS